MAAEKKARLFIRGPGTDESWYYAGGPDPAHALRGLSNLIVAHVTDLLNGKVAQEDQPPFELKVEQLTDEEVTELSDM